MPPGVLGELQRGSEATRPKPAATLPDLPAAKPASTEATRPAPSATPGERTTFDKKADQLEAALKGPEPKRAASTALAFCAGYGARRSRGARKRALDLCDAVADGSLDELSDLAAKLRVVLQAEGALHELSGDGTLRAARLLIDVVEDDA